MPQKYTFQLKYPNNSAKKCATRQKGKGACKCLQAPFLINRQWSIVNGQSSPPNLDLRVSLHDTRVTTAIDVTLDVGTIQDFDQSPYRVSELVWIQC